MGGDPGAAAARRRASWPCARSTRWRCGGACIRRGWRSWPSIPRGTSAPRARRGRTSSTPSAAAPRSSCSGPAKSEPKGSEMVMDEMMTLRLFGGMFGGAIDWAAVLLFLGVGVVYFLAPVLGYHPDRRGTLAGSLYVLVGYAGLSVIQLLML